MILGLALGLFWLRRVVQAFFGMRRVADLSTSQFDGAPANCGQELPRVTIVVPARNEAVHVEATIHSLLALDYPDYRIVAVDDRSTDATGEILDRLAAASPERLQVLHVRELPPGWLGKTHAMWRAASQPSPTTNDRPLSTGSDDRRLATDEWLLFTDADTIFRPDSLRRAVIYTLQSKADHLAVFPKIDTATFGGHIMVAFFGVLFVFWRRPWKVSDPHAPDAIGLGVFNLIRRQAYEKIGTWKSLRLCVVEDVMLGEAVKKYGLKQSAAMGQDLLTNFWSRDAAGVIRNLSKNFFAAAHFKIGRALVICGIFLILHVLPYVGVVVAPGWAKAGFGVALAGIALMYIGMSRQPNVSPLYFFAHPFAALSFVFIMLRSMALALRNGGVTWRGTTYPLEELRRGSTDTGGDSIL
jgi:glycosyltransferase involved in cell wall biosynthesis